MTIYVEIEFEDSNGIAAINGQSGNKGTLVVSDGKDIFMHRIKYIPPVFTCPKQTKILKGKNPLIVFTSKVMVTCSCGLSVTSYGGDLWYFKSRGMQDLVCPTCGSVMSSTKLKPKVLADGNDDVCDALFHGTYADDALKGLEHRMCVDLDEDNKIDLPRLYFGVEDPNCGEKLVYRKYRDVKSSYIEGDGDPVRTCVITPIACGGVMDLDIKSWDPREALRKVVRRII